MGFIKKFILSIKDLWNFLMVKSLIKIRDFGATFFYPYIINPNDLNELYTGDFYGAFYILFLDNVRNRAYQNAIRNSVNGARVLDVGTGSYVIWGKEAAASGAKKVYSIEANKKAFAIAKDYVSNIPNIKVLEGLSTEISLSRIDNEKCDVMVHEIVGSIGSNEGMVPCVADIKRRLINKNAKLIPKACTTYFSPVAQMKPSLVSRFINYIFGGIPFTNKVNQYHVYNYPEKLIMADANIFESYDFYQDYSLLQKRNYKIKIKKSGEWIGFLFWIELQVDDKNSFNTKEQKTSWTLILFTMDRKPIPLKKGDVIDAKIKVDVTSYCPHYEIDCQVKNYEGQNFSYLFDVND